MPSTDDQRTRAIGAFQPAADPAAPDGGGADPDATALRSARQGGRRMPASHPTWILAFADGRRIPIRSGAHLMGRSRSAGILLSSRLVSRSHAELTVNGTTATIRDLDSRNGTTVNGHACAPRHDVPVTSGSTIALGDEQVTLTLEQSTS